MKHSEIYLKAAKEIFNGTSDYACCAISSAGIDTVSGLYDKNHPARIKFRDLFDPENGYEEWFGSTFSEEEQNARITALLFMHEIAKDEERK